MIRLLDMAAAGSALVISAAAMVQPPGQPGDQPMTPPDGTEPSPWAHAAPAMPADELLHLDGDSLAALAWVEPSAAGDRMPAASEPAPGRSVGDPGRRARRPGRPLSPKLIEQCLEVARDVQPELAKRLLELRQESSATAFQRSIRNARHLVGLARLKERNPDLYQEKVQELRLDAQVNSALERLREARQASSTATNEFEARLRELVRQQVDHSIRARGLYLQRLEEHVKVLRDQLQHDSANFKQSVDRRVRMLTEQAQPQPPDASQPPAG